MKPFLHSALVLLTIACASTVVWAEPDEDLLSKAQGYPVGNACTGVVARTPAPSALPKAVNLVAILYRYKNNSYTLNDYFGRQRTTAPLVPKNGEMTAEQHRCSRTDDARFLSFSMVKRVISLLFGQALANGGFNASLHDWCRLDLLLAHDGQAGMKQVVPLDYLLDATDPAKQPPALRPRTATPYFGYVYQFWLMPVRARTFAMQGIHGQTVHGQPSTSTVMVLTSVWESASGKQNPQPYEERDALWRGVLQSLGGDLTPY